MTLPAFSGDSSISAFSQPASATFQQPPPVQASNKEESDYLTEQRKILEAFEKKKQSQDVVVVQQNNVVPNPLNPPASKQQHQQSVKSPFAPSQPFAAPSQPAQQPTLNGSASTNNKPSDDLLMLGGSSNAFSVQNTMPSSNFASAFNTTQSYGKISEIIRGQGSMCLPAPAIFMFLKILLYVGLFWLKRFLES